LKFSGHQVKRGVPDVLAGRLHLSHWGCHLKNPPAHLSRSAARVRRTKLHLTKRVCHLTKPSRHFKAVWFQDSRPDSKVNKQDSHRSRKWSYTGKLMAKANDGAKQTGGGDWPLRSDAENGNRDVRAPQPSPSWWPCANTGQWQFGVDERGKGHGAEYPKGISSFSPALTRSGYAGWWS